MSNDRFTEIWNIQQDRRAINKKCPKEFIGYFMMRQNSKTAVDTLHLLIEQCFTGKCEWKSKHLHGGRGAVCFRANSIAPLRDENRGILEPARKNTKNFNGFITTKENAYKKLMNIYVYNTVERLW